MTRWKRYSGTAGGTAGPRDENAPSAKLGAWFRSYPNATKQHDPLCQISPPSKKVKPL
jgi:hypothetical protein